jgi:Na+/H+ antiporter NhaD/arsenite permease-like protein
MTELATTLTAISMGAVFMGALTYIGNAPNFMLYAIASERGVPMPSFFGFVGWSVAILMPVFAVLAYFRF